MTTLVVTNKPFANLADGYDLRAWHLSRELARLDSLVLVPISCSDRDRGKVTLDPYSLFDEVVEPLVLSAGRPSILRHLRWSDANYYSLGYPRYHRQAVDLISAMLKRHSASRIVAFGGDLAGFLTPFRSARVLFDAVDSTVLYIERYVAACTNTIGVWVPRLLAVASPGPVAAMIRPTGAGEEKGSAGSGLPTLATSLWQRA